MPTSFGQDGSLGEMNSKYPMLIDPLPRVERPHMERAPIKLDDGTVPVDGLPNMWPE